MLTATFLKQLVPQTTNHQKDLTAADSSKTPSFPGLSQCNNNSKIKQFVKLYTKKLKQSTRSSASFHTESQGSSLHISAMLMNNPMAKVCGTLPGNAKKSCVARHSGRRRSSASGRTAAGPGFPPLWDTTHINTFTTTLPVVQIPKMNRNNVTQFLDSNWHFCFFVANIFLLPMFCCFYVLFSQFLTLFFFLFFG